MVHHGVQYKVSNGSNIFDPKSGFGAVLVPNPPHTTVVFYKACSDGDDHQSYDIIGNGDDGMILSTVGVSHYYFYGSVCGNSGRQRVPSEALASARLGAFYLIVSICLARLTSQGGSRGLIAPSTKYRLAAKLLVT